MIREKDGTMVMATIIEGCEGQHCRGQFLASITEGGEG